MVFNAVTLLISTFSSAMLAVFGDLIARGNNKHLGKHFNNFEYIFYAVVAFSYTCTAVLILPFIQIYTAGVNDADYMRPLMATLFIIVGIANTIRIPSNTLVNSAGHFRETKYSAIIEAVINLVASLIFVQFFGTEGVLMGGLCSYAYRTIDLIIYSSKNILKKSSTQTFIKLFRNFILSVLAGTPFLFIDVYANNLFVWLFWTMGIALWTFLIILFGNFFTEPKAMREIWNQLKGNIIKNLK